ncbi:MAG TPA: tetratricopeptide repeat protein, partial [Candidatus Methylomirabilis sp.]|nr:tetratricopeptide repeat protein [Candidatus Methylomirabilis sp.]
FQSPHPVWWYLAAVIACALGMGAKEVMVTAPVMVFLYDRLFVSRSLRHLIRQRWGFYAGLAATWVVLIVVLAVLRSERQMVLIEDLGPWRYALTQFGVIVHYLRLSYWPSSLVLDYLWPLAHGVSSILPWAIIVLALIGATVWALLRGNWVGFWGAWFFLILAPTSSVVPIADAAFEHRMYLSLAAVVVLSVIGGYELMRWAGRRFSVPDHVQGWVAVGLVLSVIAVLGALTIRRNEDYRSELAINRDVVAKRPDNPRGHNNLGLALNTLGQAAEAEDHFRTAVRLRPDVAEAQANLGAALLRRRQVDQAIVHLSEATRLKPALPEPHRDLGLALIERGDVQGAIRQFGLLLQLRPDDVNARSELASALLKAGWSKQAVPRLVASLSGDPKSSQAHFDRADALFLQGMYKASVPEYLEALRVNPRFAEAHNNLAMAMYTLGDVDGAVAHLSTALRLKPDYATAFYNLGTILYRQGHVKESVNHFAQAVRLDPALVEARDSLRAAQATLGKAGAKP